MSSWTFADVWEAIAAAQPDHPAHIQGERMLTWGEFDARADALAAHLIGAGLERQAKVAAFLYNGPEYLETYYAAFKSGLAPVNTNYRYGPEELFYLFDNADAQAVVFHAGFAEVLEAIRGRLGQVKSWIALAEPAIRSPTGRTTMTPSSPRPRSRGRRRRPGAGLRTTCCCSTPAATTGMPKGVMWRQDDLFNVIGAGGHAAMAIAPIENLEQAATRLPEPGHYRPVSLVACPQMHGTGQFSSIITLNLAARSATLPSRKFNAIELWNEAERLKADGIVIVGLAFSTPMLEALDAHPGRWDLSNVRSMSSSGSMWSQENKRGLLKPLHQRHDLRQLRLVGGGGPGRLGLRAGGRGADGRLHDRPQLRGPSPRTAVGSSRGRASAAWWR